VKVAAILLAAGRGERLRSSRPKAFVELGGKPLLSRAIVAVDACAEIEGFVVVAPPGLVDEAKRLASPSAKLVAVVAGGETRQASVRLGLAAVPMSAEAVVCHDVARPFAPPRLFADVVAALSGADGVVPAVAVSDTVKRVDGRRVLETVPREGLALIQTPQAFRRPALEDAHARAAAEGHEGTDDAALLERAGYQVATVPGDPVNLKITEPEDLERALVTIREEAD
jgi:2-C-methyl-D-erythritol 4-phosphate cytidylyltransferase